MGGLWCQASHPGVYTLAQWILSLPANERQETATRAFDGFFANEFAKKTGFAVGLFAQCPQKYLGPKTVKPSAEVEEFQRMRIQREQPWN